MGVSTSAKLIYGYRLKADEEGWLVKEKHGPDSDEYGLNLPWLDDSYDFQEKAEDRLREAVGFEDTGYETNPEDWRTRLREAQAKVGVEFEYGGYEYGDLFLAAKTVRVDLGDVTLIDPTVLGAVAATDANEKLRQALAALGITPTQGQPAWLLTACRG